jgi:hypothetical protein
MRSNSGGSCYHQCADRSFCAAAFCSLRSRRRNFAFTRVALPCRHRSTGSTTMGRPSKCLGDQLFGRFLSFVHIDPLVLGGISVSICADWLGLRSHSRIAGLSDDSLGKPIRRTVLYSKPLARIDRYVGHRRPFCLRLVARDALREQRSRRSALVHHGLRNPVFSGRRCRINWLLSGVLFGGTSASCALRATTRSLIGNPNALRC